MINLNKRSISFHKVDFFLFIWGLLILLGGAMSQWFELNLNAILALWAGVTIIGLAAQAIAMVRGLGMNYAVWILVIAAGWAFTLYVTKLDNGSHIELYGDLPGVWLILFGIGFTITAFQTDRRHLYLAAVAFAGGILLELAARGIINVPFLNTYSSILFGLFAGVPLIIASHPTWIKARQPKPAEQTAPAQASSEAQGASGG